MSRQKATFEDRLKALIVEATEEQLMRMRDVAAMLVLIQQQRNGTQPAPKKRAAKAQAELPIGAA